MTIIADGLVAGLTPGGTAPKNATLETFQNIDALMVVYETAAWFTSNNPTLNAGQRGVESDTRKAKTGDGATAWTSLDYEAGATAEAGGLTATTAPAIVLGDGATITAATHGEYTPDGADLQIITVVARHATNTALTVGLTLPEDFPMRLRIIVDEEQDGDVTISRAGTNTINGLTSVVLAGPSAEVEIIPLDTVGAFAAKGDIVAVATLAAALDCDGQQVYGNVARIWTASVNGAAPTLSGLYVIIDTALTIPTAEGFQMNGRFTGAYSLTFNSTVLSGVAAANSVIFAQVESATTITVVIDGTVYRETDFV